MDQLVYLNQDVSYTADRVDELLTLLWHPRAPEMLVGFKLKGVQRTLETMRQMGLVNADAKIDLISTIVFHRAFNGAASLEEFESEHQQQRNHKLAQAVAMAKTADTVPLRAMA